VVNISVVYRWEKNIVRYGLEVVDTLEPTTFVGSQTQVFSIFARHVVG
jgi:hypothetical protein